MRVLLASAFFVILILAACLCWGGIPHLINYEGMLTDDLGTPLDGTYNLSFKIYGSESGDDSLWWEHHTGVAVSDGLFGVMLGSISSLSYSVFNDTVRYLGITVDNGTELSPRTRLVSVPYTYRSLWSDSAAYTAVGVENDSDWTISGDDIYSAVSGNVGIGTTSPAEKLDVNGTAKVTGFKMPTGASSGHVLTSDGSGVGTWQTVPASGGGWTDDGNVVRLTTGTDSVGIGTTDPDAQFHVEGANEALFFSATTGGWPQLKVGKDRDAGNNIILGFENTNNYGYLGVAGDPKTTFVVKYGGNIGIGTDEPWSNLHIHEASAGQPTYAQFTNDYTKALPTDGFFVGINSSGNAYLSNHESQSLTIQTDNTDRMHITSAGKVGIGTTTPGKILHIGGGGQAAAQTAEGLYVNPNASSVAISAEDNTGVEGGIMAHNNGNVYIGAWSNHSVMFRTTNLDRGIIDASGNFGIGITSPTEKLDVNGTAKLRGITVGGVGTSIVVVDGTGKLWREGPGNAHKENIRGLGIDPEKVFQLEPVKFDWKTTGVEDIGLIADDVEKAIPDLVVYDNEGRPNGVRYDRITLYLLDVVKDLKAENDRLKSRIEALESKE